MLICRYSLPLQTIFMTLSMVICPVKSECALVPLYDMAVSPRCAGMGADSCIPRVTAPHSSKCKVFHDLTWAGLHMGKVLKTPSFGHKCKVMALHSAVLGCATHSKTPRWLR